MLLRFPAACSASALAIVLAFQTACSQSDTATGKPSSYDAATGDAATEGSPDAAVQDTGAEPDDSASESGDSACTTRTCLQLGATCGQVLDGCGTTLECGQCPTGQTCGGAGPNQCGSNACNPKTCTQLGASCGMVSDECSNILDCGGCASPETCGGAGVAWQCGCSCALPHAKAVCHAGACSIGSCEAGFADCNNEPGDGCEADTNADPVSCGACGAGCSYAHAAAQCTNGHCHQGDCEAGWADCNGSDQDGCEVFLSSDPENCGTCANACPGGLLALCKNGACAMSDCKGTSGDCDGNAANGCEVDLATSVANCGSCGFACLLAHATADCVAGLCAVSSCAIGYGDCDGNPTNGCETNVASSVTNCGVCGTVCPAAPNASPLCKKSFCTYTCNPGWGDCGSETAGCETYVAADVANCGSCGNACMLSHALPTCQAGACAVGSCTKYYADCNGVAGDGCEVALMSDPMHCGSCTVACASNMTCSLGSCVCAVPCAGVGCCASGQKCCLASNTCWPQGQLCPDAQ